jgi:hypothetical protein
MFIKRQSLAHGPKLEAVHRRFAEGYPLCNPGAGRRRAQRNHAPRRGRAWIAEELDQRHRHCAEYNKDPYREGQELFGSKRAKRKRRFERHRGVAEK